MSIDNMQLKQEDVLNDNVVLTDIFPKSNTKSIDDSATGESLQKTIARIWESINNKLTRVVNSVNGRSGVVVLDPNDVGLGNVDNVSFAEIQQWVIDELEKFFNNKRIRLYETFAEVTSDASSNDKTLAWAPFYCKQYNENDLRSCIGFFAWDSSTSSLYPDWKYMNTIGGTDNSIIYRTFAEEEQGQFADMKIGQIGVNIYKETGDNDQILYLEGRDSTSKRESGLRIDKTKIGSRTYQIDGFYEIDHDPFNSQNFLLYGSLTNTQITENGYPLEIYLNGIKVNDAPYEIPGGGSFFLINKNWTNFGTLRNNDIIITHFDELRSGEMVRNEHLLMNRQPAVGIVTGGPDRDHPDAPFVINFVTIQPWTNGFGITSLRTHRNRDLSIQDSQLSIDLGNMGVLKNMSGLQTTTGRVNIMNDESAFGVPTIWVYTPWGMISSWETSGASTGLFITTDNTLATFPTYHFSPNYVKGTYRCKYYTTADIPDRCTGSRFINNYSWSRYNRFTDESATAELGISSGYGGSESLLTSNMNRIVMLTYNEESTSPYHEVVPDELYFANMSGLRNVNTDISNNPRDFTYQELVDYGMPDGKDVNGNLIAGGNQGHFNGTSGGLTVNVGKFLEITPKRTALAESYYDGGKVQVRTSNGLTEEVQFVEIDYTDDSDPEVIIAKERWNLYSGMLSQVYSDTVMDNDFFYTDESHEEKTMVPMSFSLTSREPDDWGTAYYTKYAKKVSAQNLSYSEFVFLPKGTGAPTWEADKYYKYNRVAYADFINDETTNHQDFHLYRRIRTNRMTLDLDPDTLSFDDNGKVTVVGGVGGGSKVRFIDSRGCFFDTDDSTNPPDEIIKLGSGLIVSDGIVPEDFILDDNIRDTLQEYRKAFTMYEKWIWYKTVINSASQTNLDYPAHAYNTVDNNISSTINNSDYNTLRGTVSTQLSNCTDALKTLLNDTTPITIEGNQYDSNIRQYLTCSNSAIITRLTNILDSVVLITDVDDREKKWQLFCYHFNFDPTRSPITPASSAGGSISNIVNAGLRFMQTDENGNEIFPLDWIFAYYVREVLLGNQVPSEVVNEDGKVLLNVQPSDWTSNYTAYYIKTGDHTYEHVQASTTAPSFALDVYYSRNEGPSYMVLETEPGDWATNFSSYYVALVENPNFNDDNDFTHVTGTPNIPSFTTNKYYRDQTPTPQPDSENEGGDQS